MEMGENNTTRNAYLILIIAIAIVFIALVVTTIGLKPNFDLGTPNGTNIIWGDTYALKFETIPTVINGITAVTSIIIGFSGAIIGIVYREDFNKDKKVKIGLLGIAFYSAVPLTMLLVVYHALIRGAVEFASIFALNALILAFVFFILAMLSIFYRLSLHDETLSGDAEKKKEPDDKSDTPKTNEPEKNVNVFVNVT